MTKQYSITGLGYCSWDYVCAVPRIPHDAKVEIMQRTDQGGGPAATAIFAAQRLGGTTAFIGVTGDDENGQKILEEFRGCGVDISAMKKRTGFKSAVSFCWAEQGTGRRSIAWSRGNAAPLRPEEIDLDVVRASRALHLDGHQTPAALHAAAVAKAAGVTVCLDAGTLLPGMEDLLRLSDIVIASEEFARAFTGQGDLNEAIVDLHKCGARMTVVTQGPLGSLGHEGRQSVHIPAFPAQVVDTTGAGDVYHGAFLYRHLSGGDLADCMRYASGAAALKCEALGGRTGLPTGDQLEQFLREHSIGG